MTWILLLSPSELLCHFNRVWLFATLWIIAHQAPQSLGFSRQECWRGLPLPFLGDLPYAGIKSKSLGCPALVGGFFTTGTTIPSAHCTELLAGVSLRGVGHIHRRIYRTSNFRLRNGALRWPRPPRVPEPKGPVLGTSQAGWDPQSQGAPTGMQFSGDSLPAWSLGVCVSFILFPEAQDWQRRGCLNLLP